MDNFDQSNGVADTNPNPTATENNYGQPNYTQPNYGQAPYSQPNYAQPNYQYPPQQPYGQYSHDITGKTGRGGGWIGFVRVFIWISFGLLCFTAIGAGFACAEEFNGAVGILAFVVGMLIAFASVASSMIWLDLCNNVRKMTTNTEKILQALSRK